MSEDINFVCKSELSLETQLESANDNFSRLSKKWAQDQVILNSQKLRLKDLKVHIKQSEKEIAKLQATINEMSEVIKFYGDNNNWLFDSLSRQNAVITIKDRDKSNEFTIQSSGGKKARQLINKHPDIFGKGE